MDLEAVADGPVNASSTTGIPTEGDRDSEQNENVKMDCGLVDSSESVSSMRVEKRKAAAAAAEEAKKRDLNVMHEDTLEAAMLDLEELVNKVKWLQRILQSSATSTSSSWKFAK
ncbi:hypothetical protein M8C21_012656 [Ambrosia artemisiifolia]|uniref:Uncharacterized protein n=1 Tax=Ambrosia artemisiifolia TaxID=4212 RepID=A0AAD5CVB7_AMBAR|nr:hypothetical protein M8C21_012656 [Ambrosia artemisiifolia]